MLLMQKKELILDCRKYSANREDIYILITITILLDYFQGSTSNEFYIIVYKN